MPNPISTVTVIDTSNSMTIFGYVAITVIDSKAFVSCMRPGDSLGVVNYDVNGNTAFPFTVVQAPQTSQSAGTAIQNLSFVGGCTNIGGGIQAARSMLDNAPNARGMVLLSDGYQNCGTAPLSVLPSGYPIYACAMGPNSDQGLLQQIATGTQGQYYYAPYVVQMMQIYNQIRALNPLTQIVANNLSNITPQNYELIPATISSGNSEAQVAVVWTDPSFVYTSGPPSGNQLSITLVDPNLNIVTTPPWQVGSGFVVFDLPNPLAGQWQVQVEYPGTSQPLPVTAGVFEFQSNAASPLQLEVEVPQTINAGEPLPFTAKVTDDGEPVSGLSVHAEIVQPKISIRNAINLYNDQLSAVEPAVTDISNGIPDEVARLTALRLQRLPQIDILPHRQYAVPLPAGEDGHYKNTINSTHEAGSYNVHVRVSGYAKKSGTAFQRCQLVSVLVK
jgi:hypothetical protein